MFHTPVNPATLENLTVYLSERRPQRISSGFHTLANPKPAKSFTFTVANSVTPCLSKSANNESGGRSGGQKPVCLTWRRAPAAYQAKP